MVSGVAGTVLGSVPACCYFTPTLIVAIFVPASYRALVLLTAQPGSEQALVNYTLEVAPQIRAVDGLEKLEVSQAVDAPAQLVLYYTGDQNTNPSSRARCSDSSSVHRRRGILWFEQGLEPRTSSRNRAAP